MKICTKCGKVFKDESLFCDKCGLELEIKENNSLIYQDELLLRQRLLNNIFVIVFSFLTFIWMFIELLYLWGEGNTYKAVLVGIHSGFTVLPILTLILSLIGLVLKKSNKVIAIIGLVISCLAVMLIFISASLIATGVLRLYY